MIKANLEFYGLQIQGMTEELDVNNMRMTTIKITNTMRIEEPHIAEFARDMTLMNTIRNSTDPAVKEAFAQVLTVMALTYGRPLPVYDDVDAVQMSDPK